MSFFQPLCFYQQVLLVDSGCLAQQSCIGTAFYSHQCALADAPLSLPGAHFCSVFTGPSGKAEDSVSLDNGLNQDNIGKAVLGNLH